MSHLLFMTFFLRLQRRASLRSAQTIIYILKGSVNPGTTSGKSRKRLLF
jgi:hypothetical protein